MPYPVRTVALLISLKAESVPQPNDKLENELPSLLSSEIITLEQS